MRFRLCTALAALAVAAAAQAPAASLITDWNPIVVSSVLADAPGPTVSTHVFSSVYTAAYEAWAAYDPVAQGPLSGNLVDGMGGASTRPNTEEAISHAIYTTLEWFAPSHLAEARAFMQQRGWTPGANTAPARLGRDVADRVASLRIWDSSNQAKGYRDLSQYDPQPATVATAWQPLEQGGGAVQQPVTPHWGGVFPFALRSGDQFRPAAPAAVGTERWHAQILQLLSMSAGLTDEQKASVEYWQMAEGSLPVLLARLTETVSVERGYSLDQDAKLFFAVHNALLDAGISAWDAKYHYEYVRPVTAIRGMGNTMVDAWAGPGAGTRRIPASSFVPYQPQGSMAPAYPEYTSSHGTLTAAWAEVMRAFAGSDDLGISVTVDRLAVEGVDLSPPVALSWPTFTAAAQDAGMSGLYAGVNFYDATVVGSQAGRQVGAAAWAKAKGCFEGTVRSPFAVVERLTTANWTQETLPGVFDPPLFATIGGLGLTVAKGGNTFGYWQTGEMDPLPAGEYKLSVDLVGMVGPKETRLPELRLRVFNADSSFSAMALAAHTDRRNPYVAVGDPDNPEHYLRPRREGAALPVPGEGKPGSSVSVYWRSDGRKPFRIALDLLAFDPNIAGGVVASRISFRRTSP